MLVVLAAAAAFSATWCLLYYVYVKLSFNYKESWRKIQMANAELLSGLKATVPFLPSAQRAQYQFIISALADTLAWAPPQTYDQYRSYMLRLLPLIKALDKL